MHFVKLVLPFLQSDSNLTWQFLIKRKNMNLWKAGQAAVEVSCIKTLAFMNAVQIQKTHSTISMKGSFYVIFNMSN